MVILVAPVATAAASSVDLGWVWVSISSWTGFAFGFGDSGGGFCESGPPRGSGGGVAFAGFWFGDYR